MHLFSNSSKLIPSNLLIAFSKFVSQVITGYLPSLILYSFLSLVPPVMKLFSTMQGYISSSEIEKSACSKMILFTVWNAFFAVVLSGSVASQAEVFLDPRHIPERLAVAVPAQVSAHPLVFFRGFCQLCCKVPLWKHLHFHSGLIFHNLRGDIWMDKSIIGDN